jgi:hypothetical protein
VGIRKIISRSTWNARPPRSTPVKVTWHRNIEVWIHHSDYPTLNEQETLANERKRMKVLQDLHLDNREWDDIGYNYVIMPSGRIYEGRGKEIQGSHCYGQNSEPGICFDGRYNSVIPSQAALKSFFWLLDSLKLGKDRFRGHRDGWKVNGISQTTCPGDALYNYLVLNKRKVSWEIEKSDENLNSSNEKTDSSEKAVPKKLPGNAVNRIVPTPSDDFFSPDLIANRDNYYNTLDPDFKKNKTSKYLAPDKKYLEDREKERQQKQNSGPPIDVSNYAYFSGGYYDAGNMCSFEYIKNTTTGPERKSIYLIVPPNNISWTYSLRTKIEDTYGGQVIQILGVQIDNFKLSGYIPDGFWGRDNNYYDRSDGIPYFEDRENARKNGIIHLANFFRDFFAAKSQNSFSTKNMEFNYPHYGWVGNSTLKLIPYEFPRVRIANDEILPEWELECSLVEHLSSTFVSKVEKASAAASQLEYLKNGIGFIEFVQWSDPSATSDISVSEQAKSLGASYAEFVNNFEISEVDTLSQAGFSYPPDIIDKTVTTEVQKVIQDRFGTNV